MVVWYTTAYLLPICSFRVQFNQGNHWGSNVMPHHATISSQISVNIWISIVYSLISKSLNFIFIVIDLGGENTQWIGARPSIFYLKITRPVTHTWGLGRTFWLCTYGLAMWERYYIYLIPYYYKGTVHENSKMKEIIW